MFALLIRAESHQIWKTSRTVRMWVVVSSLQFILKKGKLFTKSSRSARKVSYPCRIILVSASSHPTCIILVLSYYSGDVLFTDSKSKVPKKYQQANCLCGPGSTYYYVNKDGNTEPIFALTQHKTNPANNIAMFLEPHLPRLEALGLLICRYKSERSFFPGQELFADYWVRESGKWYQYHTEAGIPSVFTLSQDGQFLQIEDDDDDSDFELPKVKKVPKVKKKRTSKTKLLQLEDDDDDSDFEAPKVKKERTSTKKSPPVVETSNSSVAEWLPPVGSMVHVKWQYRQVWRAKTKGYVEDENDPDNLAVHFTFPTGEVWDCNLIQFNERVTLESDILETHGIPCWVPKAGTQYEYHKSEKNWFPVEVLGNPLHPPPSSSVCTILLPYLQQSYPTSRSHIHHPPTVTPPSLYPTKHFQVTRANTRCAWL